LLSSERYSNRKADVPSVAVANSTISTTTTGVTTALLTAADTRKLDNYNYRTKSLLMLYDLVDTGQCGMKTLTTTLGKIPYTSRPEVTSTSVVVHSAQVHIIYSMKYHGSK
jgi:hypothetical protein